MAVYYPACIVCNGILWRPVLQYMGCRMKEIQDYFEKLNELPLSEIHVGEALVLIMLIIVFYCLFK